MTAPGQDTASDARIVMLIVETFRFGWVGEPAELLANISGWSPDEARGELCQEDPTERIRLFEVLLVSHEAPENRRFSVTPKMVAELTGWSHQRVERALQAAVAGGARVAFTPTEELLA